jgi:hypothetical protein
MQHYIIGSGEVGKCIGENIKGDVTYYDKEIWHEYNLCIINNKDYNIIHICFPYSENFIPQVAKLFSKNKNGYMKTTFIIHSTVEPKILTGMDKQILYSPVVGRHGDDFGRDVKRYKKFFAGDRKVYESIKNSFDFDTEYWGTNRAELAYSKVMCTSYMYWNLIYNKVIHAECKQKGYDFNKVYKRWNRNYNKGLKELHPEWTRPIYEYMKGVGGHCLTNNIFLSDNKILKILKRFQKENE